MFVFSENLKSPPLLPENSKNRGYVEEFGRKIRQQGESKFEFPRTGYIQESKCSKSNSWKSNALFFQWSKSLYSWFRQHKLVGVSKHSKIDFRYCGFIDERSTEVDTIFNCHFESQIAPTSRSNCDL